MKTKETNLLWGYHPVREALRAKRRLIFTLYVAQDNGEARGRELGMLAQASAIAVQVLSTQELTRLVGHPRHQGVAAQAAPYPFTDLETLLSTASAGTAAPLLVILDQVVDPQNFGAMARTAHCAGAQGIIVPKDRSAPPSSAASKASAGALEHLPVVCVNNLATTIQTLKQRGLWIVGADRGGPHCLFDIELTMPLAIVIGGEEKGVRPLVKKQCDFVVSIPQSGVIGSLNASAAAAVILYEVYRQRRSLPR